MIPLPTLDALDAVTIPVTCPVSWDAMHGDNRTRFCDRCGQNVHDVRELTRAEALELLTDGDKLPCLRIYKRQDGSVMTADCATKRDRAWKWLHNRSKWAAALFAIVFFAGCGSKPKECIAGKPIMPQPKQPPATQVTTDAAQSVVAGVQYTVEYPRR